MSTPFNAFRPIGQSFPVIPARNFSKLAFMLVGTGIDIVEIARIAASIARYGDLFLARVFTPGEIAYCTRKRSFAESFAARFAAKEAGAKALGTGIQFGVTWKEIEVRREPGRRPTLHFTGRAGEIASHLGVRHISLSLTHNATVAIASVQLESVQLESGQT